jgi:hypothetical protein
VDARKTFVEKWKGLACNDFTRQREHVSLIPQSIISFMQDRLREGLPGSKESNRVAEFHMQSDVHQGGMSHVQIISPYWIIVWTS